MDANDQTTGSHLAINWYTMCPCKLTVIKCRADSLKFSDSPESNIFNEESKVFSFIFHYSVFRRLILKTKVRDRSLMYTLAHFSDSCRKKIAVRVWVIALMQDCQL